MRGELHRLENIVRQFLSLAGPSAVNRQQVDLGKIISHVCELLRPEATSRQIDIVVDVPSDFPCVIADADQLTQALLNLVINALQAIERKGMVSISAVVNAAGESFSICVRDTGPGLPVEEESAIFDPYFTTKEGGSGLGLWIVQQIVVAHGGVIQAANSGGGAMFTIHLPFEPRIDTNKHE